VVLDGPCSHKADSFDEVSANTASLSISQLISFNCVKRRATNATDDDSKTGLRQNRERETPLPIYIGLKIYAETRNRGLIDTMNKVWLSISYDRVMSVSTFVCIRFEHDGVVCPPKLRKHFFTTGALDNMDDNPSATTAKDSFHGTAISVVQHPSDRVCGIYRGVNVKDGNVVQQRRVRVLPASYTNVQPVVLQSNDNASTVTKELDWFNNVKSLCGRDKLNNEEFMSWAAFHASLQPSTVQQADIVALLPLFLEHAHSPTMVPHGLDVINDVVEHVNPGQMPVIAMDQPLFALGKLIQWNTSETREDKYVVMFGGLYIEIAAFKALGEFLYGSGWVNALVNADIASPGTAESFVKVSHLAKARRAHEITAATLYVLQQ